MTDKRVECLSVISDELATLHVTQADLGGGSVGMLLFAAYMAKWSGNTSHASLARAMLTRTIELIETSELGVGLYDGIAGVAWALRQAALVNADLAIPDLEEIDELLSLHYGSGECDPQKLDLISGVAGALVYLSNAPRNETTQRTFEAIIQILDATALRAPSDGLYWPCGTRNTDPTDLGAAHGTPGIVGALGLAASCGLSNPMSRALVESSTRWVRSQVRDIGTSPFVPYFASSQKAARVAWCYGAPGISCAMLQNVASESDAAPWHDLARVAASATSSSSGVVDAGLCHGEAGLMHLFSVLDQKSRCVEYASAAAYWSNELLRNWHAADGFAGFRMNRFGDWISSPGYLEGASGVGLAILTTLGMDRSWDAPLLA